MIDLTKDKALELISESIADFGESIYLYVPSTKFEQPFIMYKSNKYGHTSHYLFNDIKDKFDSGIYKYTPKSKPFDITKHEVSNHVTVLESGELGVFDSDWLINKERAIAIAKALGVTGEDLK